VRGPQLPSCSCNVGWTGVKCERKVHLIVNQSSTTYVDSFCFVFLLTNCINMYFCFVLFRPVNCGTHFSYSVDRGKWKDFAIDVSKEHSEVEIALRRTRCRVAACVCYICVNVCLLFYFCISITTSDLLLLFRHQPGAVTPPRLAFDNAKHQSPVIYDFKGWTSDMEEQKVLLRQPLLYEGRYLFSVHNRISSLARGIFELSVCMLLLF
jgi:hypothetical protein